MPTGYASACLMFCKRAEAGAPQHKTNSVLAPRNQFSRPCVGLASCRRHGVHASAKVTLQCLAYPFPDGRVAWAVSGAGARPVRCLSCQGPRCQKRRACSDHADAGHDLRADVRHRRGADRSGADAGGRQLTANAGLLAADQRRRRAIVPATICIVTPTTHPAMIIDIHTKCGSWRSTITPTQANAENAARKVPIALSSSGVSILPTQAPSAGSAFAAARGWGGVSM